MFETEAADTGSVIVVVGPSGAGKDSVLNFAARHFSGREDIHFARRFITRPTDAGGEAHQSVTETEFEMLRASRAFAVCWEAHGLKYGIPSDAGKRAGRGETVIVNGSRRALDDFRTAFARVAVVNITASPDVLARRLMTRGRETEADILSRLQRQTPDLVDQPDMVTIDNSGPLEEAGYRFIVLASDLAASRRLASLTASQKGS